MTFCALCNHHPIHPELVNMCEGCFILWCHNEETQWLHESRRRLEDYRDRHQEAA